MRRFALLAVALPFLGCDHEGPTVFDGRFDGLPRDGQPADAPGPDAAPEPPDAPPIDAPAVDS
jgi:hypothetical protein